MFFLDLMIIGPRFERGDGRWIRESEELDFYETTER